MVIKMK